MQMFFANQSCDAFTPRKQPCELGNYVAYAVDVATPEHVASALVFARENNIRVVVRNTGHEYVPLPPGPCVYVGRDICDVSSNEMVASLDDRLAREPCLSGLIISTRRKSLLITSRPRTRAPLCVSGQG